MATYQGTEMAAAEADALLAIEARIGQPVPHEVYYDRVRVSFGFITAGGHVVDLGLFMKGLTGLPPEMAGLDHVTRLHVDGNPFGTLPPVLLEMASLETLRIGGTGIATFPDVLDEWSSLRDLEIGSNGMTALPPRFGSLRWLDASSNKKLQAVPDSIGDCTTLEILDLSNNSSIIALPDSICNLHRLRVLAMSNTALERLPDGFATSLRALERLELGSTDIKSLPEDIITLDKITHIQIPSSFLVLTPPIKAWLTALRAAGNHVEGCGFWGPYDEHARLYG